MRHINIPIFIPHLGCPNNCVFCNQRSISGHEEFNILSVREEIEAVLTTVDGTDVCEIAFFGGSFTGIDRGLMVELLEIAEEYVREKKVESIRLSTRPDYISEEILDILSRYSVKTIELGLQSMCDEVLEASKRGHTRECAEAACRMIRARGFDLIGQMMIGLPESDVEKECETARMISALGADGARVYPTVVFYDTELCEMARAGAYVPLSTADAVVRTARVLDIFDAAGLPVIRVGLCASENLADALKVYGGASDAAIGEMAMNELYFTRICRDIDENFSKDTEGKELTVFVKKGNISKAVGQKKKNKAKLMQKYGFKSVKVLEKSSILGYNILLSIN